MAVDTIDRSLITQFSDMVHIEAQQMQSRLGGFVITKQMTGDVYAYDGLGDVEANEVVGRNQKIEFADIEHKRRKISRRRFIVPLPIDASDIRGRLTDPESDYAKAVAMAMMRQKDRIIYEAMFANIQTGREFETTVTAVNDGVVTVDATAGLTYEKVLEIQENFINNDVGTDFPETLVMGITGAEHTALMKETELTSGDFTRQFAIEQGEIVKAVGINLVKFASGGANPIIPAAAGERQLFAMSSRGICLGVSKDITIEIQDRYDLVETKQVVATYEIGAVRTEGVLVQKVSVTA